MSNLAIRGHAPRGREVIELLEMLGGKNEYHINITEENQNLLYTIRDDDNVIIGTYPTGSISKIFSHEEFLEKFPYKVGDKVYVNSIDYQGIGIVNSMYWDSENKIIRYEVYSDKCDSYWKVEELQPYKEETMEEELMPKIDFSKYSKNKYLLDMGDYEIKVEDGKTYVVKKKPQYPKTYEECCKTLKMPKDESYIDIDVPLSYNKVLNVFTQLLICRDAYWKIAGDWKEKRKEKAMHFVIYSTLLGEVVKDTTLNCIANYLLDFPTKEMRDAFYENFKDLIEQCKELL